MTVLAELRFTAIPAPCLILIFPKERSIIVGLVAGVEVAREIDASLWGRTIPLDIIVYKPESIQKGLKIGDFFIRNIIEKGKVVYERR